MWLQCLKVVTIILCCVEPFAVTGAKFATLSQDTLKEKYGTLKYAALVFRHGHRAPEGTYPTDPHKNYSWPLGLGQLTKEGKMREYNVGQYFAPRYNVLTGRMYKPTKVVMDASSYDRTLMSAKLFYAGYFPPTNAEIWNKKLLWQPIPVNSAPASVDNVIRQTKPCPLLDKAKARFYSTSPMIKDACSTYKNLYDHVTKHSGWNMTPCESSENSFRIMLLQDTLLVYTQNNLSLPEWTKTVYPKPLTYLRAFFQQVEVEDQTVKRLLIGPLLAVIASDMLNIAKRENKVPQTIYTRSPADTRPLHLFAGHDNTIIALLRAFNAYDVVAPQYGAGLSIELRLKNGEYYVTVVYEHSLTQPLKVIKIPGCAGNCTLTNFISFISPFIPEDWDAECQKDDTATTTQSTGPHNITSTPWTPSPLPVNGKNKKSK